MIESNNMKLSFTNFNNNNNNNNNNNKEFWNKLRENPVPYKEHAEWLQKVELELENVNIQENVEITKENVLMQLKKMLNWKTPGLDTIQGVRLKGLLVNIRG